MIQTNSLASNLAQAHLHVEERVYASLDLVGSHHLLQYQICDTMYEKSELREFILIDEAPQLQNNIKGKIQSIDPS